MIRCQRKLHARGLIGQDPARYGGAAYGNISLRVDTRQFLISGTQTGGVAEPEASNYCLIEEADPRRNLVRSRGPIAPSSETLTHASVYQADLRVGGIVHAHHARTWQCAPRLALAETASDIPYGTPAMALALAQIVNLEGPASCARMAGHEDGLIAFAPTLAEATEIMLDLLRRAGAAGARH